MNNPLISIIVPVYNASKYLDICIDSILSQTYKNFECILINDGSTDNSGNICDNYAIMDDRVKVIHKENGGVSSARNQGLDLAKGDWITFIDSDDWVDTEYINEFIKTSLDDVDLVLQGYCRHISSKKCLKYSLPQWNASGKFILKKLAEIQRDNNTTIVVESPWSKIYKKEIIDQHHIRFKIATHYSEDYLFVLKYLLYVNKVKTSPHAGYNYIKENSQLTKTIFDPEIYTSWIIDIVNGLIEVNSIYTEDNRDDIIAPLIMNKIHLIINTCYIKTDKVPKEKRINILSTIIPYLTPSRLKYLKRKYFLLKWYDILPLSLLDSLFYLYLHPISRLLKLFSSKYKELH